MIQGPPETTVSRALKRAAALLRARVTARQVEYAEIVEPPISLNDEQIARLRREWLKLFVGPCQPHK